LRRSGVLSPRLESILLLLATFVAHTSAECWEKIENPYIYSDEGLAQYMCGACNWACVGDMCGAESCNDGDYDGDGVADCRCDICGEEVPDTVFNAETGRCEGQLYDEDGNIITAEGVQIVYCDGIEPDTNYLGGDCGCLAEDPFASYDGTHLESILSADDCVYKCSAYGTPLYVYIERTTKCWCKLEEAYDVSAVNMRAALPRQCASLLNTVWLCLQNPVFVDGAIAGDVATYIENCAEPLPTPLSVEAKVAIGLGALMFCILCVALWWIVRGEKEGTYCCC